MNSENLTSPILAESTTLNPLSPIVTSPMEEDFQTAPLAGMVAEPMHLLTEEQMREKVLQIRQMRQSYHVYKQEVEKHEEEAVAKVPRQTKKVDVSEFNELF